MSATLPIGHWSWHERWLYPDQVAELPERPTAAMLRPAQLHQPLNQEQARRLVLRAGGRTTMREQQTQQPHTARGAASSNAIDSGSMHAAAAMGSGSQSARGASSSTRFALNLGPLTHEGESKEESDVALLDATLALNNPQAIQNLHNVSEPRRYRDGCFARQTSEYAHTFREPARYAADMGTSASFTPSGASTARAVLSTSSPAAASSASPPPAAAPVAAPVPGSRAPERVRGRAGAPHQFASSHSSAFWFETPEQRARVRPDQQSFRLWGRINSAHCTVPYETESARAFGAGIAQHDPIDRTHFMRVERKEYTEALLRAKNTMHLIRNSGGYESKQRK